LIIKADIRIIFNQVLASIIPSRIIVIRSIIEAMACTIKYFIEASLSYGVLFLFIKGINANKLTSSPTHIIIHDLALTVIVVPNIVLAKNSVEDKFNIIKKRGINAPIYRV
jgi:hypothetical protein